MCPFPGFPARLRRFNGSPPPRILLPILALAVMGAASAQDATPDDPALLEGLRGKPQVLSYGVEPVTLPDGSRWFAMEADVEGVCSGRLETATAVVSGFEDSPKVFSRVVSCRILSRDGETTFTEQTTGFRVLGLSFLTTLSFRNRMVHGPPGQAGLVFDLVGGDGSARKTEGSWMLETLSLPGGPAVRVRYRVSVLVEPRYPAQLFIMRTFGKAELEMTMRELMNAVDRAGSDSRGP